VLGLAVVRPPSDAFLVAATLVLTCAGAGPGAPLAYSATGHRGLVASPLVLLRNHLLLWGRRGLAVGAAAPALVSLLRFRHDPVEGHGRPRVCISATRIIAAPARWRFRSQPPINKRLAGGSTSPWVCARFPGAEAGSRWIRYEHIGLPLRYFPSLVAYFLSIPTCSLEVSLRPGRGETSPLPARAWPYRGSTAGLL